MKVLAQALGSVIASILATWLLRRFVLTAEQGSRTGAPSSVVFVIIPVMAGNHWHIGESQPGCGRRGLGARLGRSRKAG